MNDPHDPRQDTPWPGLCGTCRHAETIVTDRGSRFLLCGLSLTDPRFRRYPNLPVLACPGHEPIPES